MARADRIRENIWAFYHHPTAEPASMVINGHVALIEADITRLEVDVIVNAANRKLLKGTGLCEAVFAGAGWLLEQQCQ